ncbi:sensor histidine kinase [Magnetospirillum molischianum]|uniref:histidine kinase n=1 Tax=Magnetospirillum molischianum DSM 120 TaxID=1150626 RepID=H8FV27_MAGML|nr:PAS domain-containing sensor histidine kinase [Magnetospirillum molischianum]CCG42215.1 Putative two-component sensor histidine kinase, classical system [Magnetospirillum molischianum DSM 120]
MAGLFVVAVAVSLRDAIDYQGERARLVASLAEESLTRSLESTESTLAVIGAVAQKSNDDGALRLAFEQSLRFAPHLRQVVVVRPDGRVVADSASRSVGQTVDLARLGLHNGISRENVSDLTQLDLGGEVIGRYLPLLNMPPDLSPRSIVPVALAAGPDLIVIGALNPTHLLRLLSLVGLGPSSSVRLTRLDGLPILVAEDPNRSILADGRGVSLMSAVDEGLQSGVLPLSDPGKSGVVAFRLSSHYPLAVVAVVSRRDGIETWLRSSGTLLFWGAVSLGGLLVGGGLLLREMFRRIGLQDEVRLLGLTQTVFAHSAEAMLILGEDGRILAANPVFATLTGEEEAALVGRFPADFLGPETVEAAGNDGPSHWRLRSLSGASRAVTVTRAPLGSDTVIMTLNDITDRIDNERRLQDALRQAEFANRAKSEFLAAMSHELRTPLNAILGFSEIIRDELGGPIDPAVCHEYVTDIYNSGSHLRDIINDLLDLARIEAGKHNLVPQPIDINAEIATCARLVRERASHHGLVLSVVESPLQPVLFADQRAVRQMLFNLLSNAIKFTSTGGRVTVSCVRDPDGTVRLIVSDTGIGIAPELHEVVFHAYERVPNTVVRKIEGSGLGLALVRTMMDQHGGAVTLESTPGIGSTFTLVFPPAGC